MIIPCTDLQVTYRLYQAEYEAAALRALRSGRYILGPELEAFEREFADYLGVKHCIGLNSGMDALVLAVRALEIGPGDEVIVPANTYIASVLGVTENGATPVFVEPDETMNIDAARIEAAITSRTRAIMPVHLYGQACSMAAIMDVACRHGLDVIEDCAQSHGACWAEKQTGTFGTIGCFSFYPTKPLGALGDSGCVVTNDDALAEKLRMLRNYGSRKKYHNETTGVNSRLDEVQAALLRVGLQHLEDGNAYRRAIAAQYRSGIRNPAIVLPLTRTGAGHVYHQFPIRIRERDALQAHLAREGIQTIIHYPIPPHLSACYRSLGHARGAFPVTEDYADTELSLPIYAGMPAEHAVRVIEAINRF